jgi:hypothetical protein
VQKVIVQADRAADIRVAIAWIHMLPLDNAAAARGMAATMQDPRVQHFHDPQGHAGAAVAASLGAAGNVAWDIYLFYPAGQGWQDGPPAPADWAHQLQGSTWADASHYHRGNDLVRQMETAMARILAYSEILRLSRELNGSGVTANSVWEASRDELAARP